MIRDSRELYITINIKNDFKERLKTLLLYQPKSDIVNGEISALKSTILNLENQITCFVDAQNGKLRFDEIDNLNDLPKVVNGKKIQSGLSSDDIANKMNISIDEYKILEDDDFYNISDQNIQKLLSVLGIKNRIKTMNRNISEEIKFIENKIKVLNIDKHIMNSLLPITIDNIKSSSNDGTKNIHLLINKFFSEFRKMFLFDINEDDVINAITRNISVAYKKSIKINQKSLNTATIIALNVAKIICRQIPEALNFPKADPIEIREDIIKKYTDVSFESCLEYTWSLNIPVFSLSIKKGFHGACFNFHEKKIIVLNQQNNAISRWKFDLLHELYHALTMKNFIYIGEEDKMLWNDINEKNASTFSSFVIFGCEVDTFLKIVLERCDGHVEYLKRNIQSVALEYHLNVDDFSNYTAYRINSMDAWKIATVLQQSNTSPNKIVNDIFLRNILNTDFDDDEISILQRAIFWEDDNGYYYN
jgi:Zn-dependent peptidase ImmA (M78 family)